nr:fimbria/pilus outer membrane usher protein [Bordetella genomosp. 13]
MSINGQATTLISRFREANGRLYALPSDLDSLGIKLDGTGVRQGGDVALDAIPGLRYRYDAATQSVSIEAPDRLRKPFGLDTRGLQPTPPATSGRGLLLNYDAYALTGRDGSLAVWNEARWFAPSGAFSNTGIGYLYGPLRRYTRFDTYWASSDAQTLRTTQVGDMISGSLDWSRSVRLGGLQWRKNFSLRPDLVTFPLPLLSGSAAVPSAVDVYVNNIRQYSGNVPSGPFVVNNVPGITGAGVASIVTRDALGRPISTSLPIYIDSRLLSEGLSGYSVDVGFLRRNYGLRSFDYQPRPAGSGTYRYGVSDALTVEAHAEASRDVYNLGGGAMVRLGSAGVIDASLAASTGDFQGAQAGVGYQYIRPDFSLDVRALRKIADYGDLASGDGTPVPDANDRITLSMPIGRSQTVAVSYIGLRYPGIEKSEIGSLSYAVNAGQRITLNLNAFKDFNRPDSSGFFLGVSIGLDDGISATATAGRQGGRDTYNVGATRTPDYGGGWGWGVQAGSAGVVDYRQAWGQYLGRYGQATATAQQLDGRTQLSLDMSGGVVVMDGHVEASRQIYDGFALVSTDGVAGVPVLSQNRRIGHTGSSGYLVVPNLNAYQRNEISIDTLALPADARIGSTRQEVVPQALSGVLARFEMNRYSAASIILRGPGGKPPAVGSRVRHEQSGKETVVGYDGIAFVDGLVERNTVRVEGKDLACVASFRYQRPADGSLPTIGPLDCVPTAGRP